jgi:hypothetical protein
MANYDFEQHMTPEQVTLAKEMGAYARERGKGDHLYRDLALGDMLIVGRKVAMELAGVPLNNKADGRRYADQFYAWKQRMGYPTTKDYSPLYDAAIVCAEHRVDADDIIASLSVKERIKLGIHGLAKRVRERINEREGGLRKPHKPRLSPLKAMKERLDEAESQLRDMSEKLAAVDNGDDGSLFDLHKDTAADIAETTFRHVGLARTRGIRDALTKLIKREEDALRKTPKQAG